MNRWCLALLGLSVGLLLSEPARAATVTPEIRVRTARVTGDVPSTRAFQATLTHKRPELLRCYRAALARTPGVVGLLGGDVRVDPGGKVGAVQVSRATVDAGLKACVVKSVGAWQIAGWKAPKRVFVQLELLFQLTATPAPGSVIKGGIPARVVAGTVEARLPTLREACLKGVPPKRHHRPRIRVLTDFDGSVQTATLYGRVPRRAMRQCLIAKMKAWNFPPPDNGHRTWVLYPLYPRAAAHAKSARATPQ